MLLTNPAWLRSRHRRRARERYLRAERLAAHHHAEIVLGKLIPLVVVGVQLIFTTLACGLGWALATGKRIGSSS
jgi:hypothetical protein